MALDKIVDSTKLDNALTATADAIREKGGGATGSENGAIVTITDALDAPAVALSTAINPVQSGSGDPSPTNIRPISGFSEANVTRAGGNLFDEATASRYNRYLAISSGQWLSHSGSRSYAYDCEPNTTYVISASNENLTIFRAAYIKVDSWTGTTALDMYGYQALTEPGILTVTTDADAKKIVIQVNQSIADARNVGMEIRKADVYSISFGTAGTVYGGTLDVVNGTLTVTHRYILADGVNVKTTGGYGAAGSKWLPCIVLSTVDKVDPSTPIVATSYLKTSGVNVQNDENSAAHGNSGAVIALHIGTMQGTDGTYGYSSANEVHAAVNAYLQTNPLQICYKLATPQTYQLTPTEVTLLAGTNNVWSDTGNITLKYSIDSELIPFDLENETGFADAINNISSGIEVDDIIIIGDYGLCLNNFIISDNTCISEAGTVSGNTLIAV